MFARGGFHSGSLREIAKRVGLTPTGLMHHFASKEELFTEVIRQRDERVRAAAGDPAEHTLIEQAAKVVEYNQHSRGLTSLFATVSAEATDPEHPAHDEFAERYRVNAANAAPLLRAAQEAGEIAPTWTPSSPPPHQCGDGRHPGAVADGRIGRHDGAVRRFVRGYLPPPSTAGRLRPTRAASRALQARTSAFDSGDLSEPREARLRGAARRSRDPRDEPERRAEAAPLVVVERAPVQVAAHVDAVVDARVHGLERAVV